MCTVSGSPGGSILEGKNEEPTSTRGRMGVLPSATLEGDSTYPMACLSSLPDLDGSSLGGLWPRMSLKYSVDKT